MSFSINICNTINRFLHLGFVVHTKGTPATSVDFRIACYSVCIALQFTLVLKELDHDVSAHRPVRGITNFLHSQPCFL